MVYLALGTNLGDREGNLERAIERLNEGRITVVRRSSIYETEPRDVMDQPWFLNMVVECETRFFPKQLMGKLLRIEKQMGRNRGGGVVLRGPRLIDIDVLLFRDAVMETTELTVPHPRMHERRFVLEPLLELAPDARDPRTGERFRKALAAVRGQKITKVTS
jgi:2-amino-4-hydroxy-6-hydroxymethyldihydropteridine diphosphokinase